MSELRVRSALRSCMYPAVRTLNCEIRQRIAILSGVVPSFYQKQIAQEIARKVEGVDRVENRVQVK